MSLEYRLRHLLGTLAVTLMTLAAAGMLGGCSPSSASDEPVSTQPLTSRVSDLAQKLSAENIIGRPGSVTSAPCLPEDAAVMAGATFTNCDVLSIQSQGMTYRAYLFSRSSHQLTLYHEGHNAPERLGLADAIMPDARDLLAELLEFSDVLYFDMPLLGVNSQQRMMLKGREITAQTHNRFAVLDQPGNSALSYFLNPIHLAVDNLAVRYSTLKMIGRSGGGWTTTLYAALDPRIVESLSVAGTAPIVARSIDSDGRDDLGDWEQFGATIYHWLDYEDLYALAGSGGRRHEQLYFEFDNCCFSGIKGEEARQIYEKAYGVQTTVQFTVLAGATNHYGMPAGLLAQRMRD